jgi:hypothetical protein
MLLFVFSNRLGRTIPFGCNHKNLVITINFYEAIHIAAIFIGLYYFKISTKGIFNYFILGEYKYGNYDIIQVSHVLFQFLFSLFLILRGNIVAKMIVKHRGLGKNSA